MLTVTPFDANRPAVLRCWNRPFRARCNQAVDLLSEAIEPPRASRPGPRPGAETAGRWPGGLTYRPARSYRDH